MINTLYPSFPLVLLLVVEYCPIENEVVLDLLPTKQVLHQPAEVPVVIIITKVSRNVYYSISGLCTFFSIFNCTIDQSPAAV